MKWSEFLRCLSKIVDGIDISLEETAQLSWKTRARLVRTDPVTSSRYHRHRMEALLSVMRKNPCVSGQILDYFWRDEFQQCGTPHTHMVVYIKDAPILGVHSDVRICEFADQFISTSIDGILAQNLEAQQHKHSKRYCLRRCDQGRSFYCRFGFPKFPMLETTIIRPLPSEMSKEDCQKHHSSYDKIWNAVQRLDAKQQLSRKASATDHELPTVQSVPEFLSELSLLWSEYVLGLRSLVQKPTILYKRSADAIRMNSYNPRILELQISNTDAQFVLDPYSAATYISSYMMKWNFALSRMMKNACGSVREASGNAGQVL
jgi:hypothetical protein